MSGQSERRASRRTGKGEAGIVSAQVRPGHTAAVVDVSSGGALIEVSKRLMPGAALDLRLETEDQRSTLRGRVLRCAVSRLHSTYVSYRAAIAFIGKSWPAAAEPVEEVAVSTPEPFAPVGQTDVAPASPADRRRRNTAVPGEHDLLAGVFGRLRSQLDNTLRNARCSMDTPDQP